MPTEAELFQGIAENPGELERWLILADWLEDQADPCAELARLRYLLHTEPDHLQREERLARQLTLLDSGLAPVAPTRSDNALNVPLALILTGTFLMGSPEEEEGRYNDEMLHPVTLTKPYYLGISTVTVAEFEAFAERTGYQTRAEKVGGKGSWRQPGCHQDGHHPVVCVSWCDAMAMAEWLNRNAPSSDLEYGLPTEAQWEYACRAGTRGAFWWREGAGHLGEYAWYRANSSEGTHPVKTKRPNPWGLWHQHGHVWEWCRDEYNLRADPPVVNPGEATSGESDRVLRGGSWKEHSWCCRSAWRNCDDPNSHDPDHGFRLAAFVPEPRTCFV